MKKQNKLRLSLKMKSKSLLISLKKPNKNMRNSRKIIKRLLTREISWVLNLLEEMMNLLYFMRKSKFCKAP